MTPDSSCKLPRCPTCGMPAHVVWVHGHGQCSHCMTNVAPCCQPEPAPGSPRPNPGQDA